ncbi:IS701 family transposase, partial [Streptomyces sp. NPDC002187]
MIDDSGDRTDGTATAHVGKQYLGSVGKIDRGVVTVITCSADERGYYPLHAKRSKLRSSPRSGTTACGRMAHAMGRQLRLRGGRSTVSWR